ncbi:uncharacterized protein LOC112512560 [Cynara cardunculus var. scolymus]|uniref:uncharacterized protein LOC112512560 n=1 Tax=Cynara cardunculus var. scolymus TaxID=59895 RepID=UPI000D626BC4|nr:uncharacterized protein LOC112512560 [Cynara cardunculus var. scolymus]
MAIPIEETPEDRNARRTSVSISMVAVDGASRSVRGKTRTYYISSSQTTSGEERRILSRYLRPPMGSCHDRCKDCIHELEESRRPTARRGSRKRHFVKNKGVPRTHVALVDREKIARTRPRPSPDPYICDPAQPVQGSKHRKATRNELKMPKSHPTSSTLDASAGLNGQNNRKDIKTIKNTASKAARTGLLPPRPPVSSKGSKNRNHKRASSPVKDQNRMTRTKLKQMISEKVQEKMLHESETESEGKPETRKLEFVPTSVEIIQSPPTVTTDSTNLMEEEPVLLSSESTSELVDEKEVQSPYGKIILEECENGNNEEGIILEDDDDTVETSEGKKGRSYRVVFCEDEDDDDDIKFRRGKVLELLSEENGPRRLKFRRGRVVDKNGEEGIARLTFKKKEIEERKESEEGEKVNLKHQEVEKKDVQELFNIVIEETASKLAGDRKTKVGALVGAFETVISLQDDTSSSDEEKRQKPELH